MKTVPFLQLSMVVAAFLTIGCMCARAQITWQAAQTITGNSDLIGPLSTPDAVTFDAFLTNSGPGFSPVTVDGITFNLSNAGNSNALTQGDGAISYTVTSGANNHYSYVGTFPTAFPSSPEFAAVMDSGGTYQVGGAGAGSITVSGLMLGNTYAIQIFNYAVDGDQGLTTFSSSGGNSVTLNNLGSGQFATGTFVATSTSQTLEWAGAGSGYTVVGAINVANITAVPEPSAIGLMSVGCLFAATAIRARKIRIWT